MSLEIRQILTEILTLKAVNPKKYEFAISNII